MKSMSIEEIKSNYIVEKEGTFMPLIFVDMAIGSAVIAAGVMKLVQQIQQEFKSSFEPSSVKVLPYVSYIKANCPKLHELVNSSKDVSVE